MTVPRLPRNLQQQLSLPTDSKDLIVPQFAALYRHLGQSILDPRDASSLAQNRSHDENGVESDLKEQWINQARIGLMIRSLREICVNPVADKDGGVLQASLRETGLVIAAYLSESLGFRPAHYAISTTQSKIDIDYLMAADVDEFRGRMEDIAMRMGRHVLELEKTMQEMLSILSVEGSQSQTTVKMSTKSTQIPSNVSTTTASIARKPQPMNRTTVSPSANLLREHLDRYNTNLTHNIPGMLNDLTTTLQTLLDIQTFLLTTQIHHLETFTHSTQSRHLITHASFLATVSNGIALKAQILNLLREKEIYAQEDMHAALAGKYTALRREETDLAERESNLNSLLAEYAAFPGGEDTFKTLGTEYARVEAEIQETKIDIERLEKQQQHPARGLASEKSGHTTTAGRTRRKQ